MTSPPIEPPPVDLDEDERIEAAMTPGPWRIDSDEPDVLMAPSGPVFCATEIGGPDMGSAIGVLCLIADQVGIVRMRNVWAARTAELRATRTETAAIVAWLRRCADPRWTASDFADGIESGDHRAATDPKDERPTLLAELRAARLTIERLEADKEAAMDALADEIKRWRAATGVDFAHEARAREAALASALDEALAFAKTFARRPPVHKAELDRLDALAAIAHPVKP